MSAVNAKLDIARQHLANALALEQEAIAQVPGDSHCHRPQGRVPRGTRQGPRGRRRTQGHARFDPRCSGHALRSSSKALKAGRGRLMRSSRLARGRLSTAAHSRQCLPFPHAAARGVRGERRRSPRQSQLASGTTAASSSVAPSVRPRPARRRSARLRPAPARSGSAEPAPPASGLSSSDAKAIDAELSAIEKELDSMALPSDSDFGGIESGLE